MASPEPVDLDADLPSFRALKRRKVYRKRSSQTPPVSPLPPPTQTLDDLILTESTPETATSLSPPSVAKILRQRKLQQRKRVGGIEFSASRTTTNAEQALVISDNAQNSPETRVDVDIVAHRFAPQTGQVADVDKHM